MHSPSLAEVYPLVWGPCGLACLSGLCRGQFADTQIQNISRDTQVRKYMETQIHIVPFCKYKLDTNFDRTHKYNVCSVRANLRIHRAEKLGLALPYPVRTEICPHKVS